MNFNYFEGKNPDVKEIISLADTMPFFADRRLILVDGSGFFKSAQEELAAYLPQMPDTTCLVFAESEVDKRNRLYKREMCIRDRYDPAAYPGTAHSPVLQADAGGASDHRRAEPVPDPEQ